VKRLLLLVAFVLCSVGLFAQGGTVTTLQVQNSGSTVFTRSGFIRMNFTAGCTASVVSGSLNLACTGSANNPGGIANQIQYNNAGTSFAGFTMSGDCTIVVGTGVITCTKTSGTSFSALATTTPGTGVATFLATPTSANLFSALTTKTGSGGSVVFATGPTISSPILSTAAQLSYITGSTQCLHVDTLGNITGTGSDCGAGGGGGTTTNALTINNGNAGAVSGSTFNGSAAVTISTNTIGAPNLTTANTYSGAGLQDFSSKTMKLPVAAGFTTTANGNMGYDSTNNNWHMWQNGADQINAVINGATTNNDCAKFVVSGSTVSLQDAGAACGGSVASPSALWLPMATTGEPAIALSTVTGAGVNTVSCAQFSVPTTMTATKFVAAVGAASGGQTVNVGIYDSSLNLIRDSGSLSCTTAGTAAVTSTVSSFSLNPGSTYYQCVAFTDATCGLQGVAVSSSFTNVANKNATREFTCANALSAGALPSACGAQTPGQQKKYLVLLEQ
jgi:hypothetical protein